VRAVAAGREENELIETRDAEMPPVPGPTVTGALAPMLNE
jgi:hypothetical protein